MTQTNRIKLKPSLILLWVLLAIYTGVCFYLFYMQSIQPLDYENRYFQSDLPYHISMIIDDGWFYSFTAYIYLALYYVAGKTTILIALFLALISFGSIYLTDCLVRKLMRKEQTDTLTLLIAFIANLVMPFFFPYAGIYRYVSYQSGNIWHNSTYQCMKFFALAAFLLYLNVEEEYREHIRLGQWIAFAIILAICTGIKPSFLTVFAPIMAIKLIIDWIRKTKFKQIFLFGLSVIPSVLVMLWQSLVLFGDDTGNGFIFAPWATFSLHADRPKLAVICSIAFPLIVLFFTALYFVANKFRDLGNHRQFLFVWAMTVLGFAEALCLQETGTRSRDGNFLWGYSIAIFIVLVYSIVYWVRILKSTKLVKNSKLWIVYLTASILCGLVLLYQLCCGILFFIRLVCGESYFMIL